MEEFILENIKVVIGLAVAFFWIVGKISEARKKQQEQQPWSPPEQQEGDDGYPPQEYYEPEAPEVYERPAVPPPLPPSMPRPVAQFIPSEEGELNRQRAMEERLRALRKEKTTAKSTRTARKAAQPPPMVSPSIKARLRDRRELRRAIIMREILDPPVGLR